MPNLRPLLKTMKHPIRLRVVFALALSLAFSGCITPKWFVDPSVAKLTYEDLHHAAQPLRLTLAVAFQRNGVPYPKADSTLRDDTERILRASRVIVPVSGGSEGQIKVTVNNIADQSAAAAKGFGTGLTFGLVGSTVMDAYELSITITVGSKIFTRMAVRHAFYTMIGNTTAPAGVETVPPNVAFQRVLEQMLIRVLREYQGTATDQAKSPEATPGDRAPATQSPASGAPKL
jgi:hypothetical protein